MRTRLIFLLLLMGFAWPTVHAQGSDPTVRDELIQSAERWQARERDDLAAAALEKWLRIQPDDAEVTRDLGLLRLREGKIELALQVLNTLRQRHPQRIETRQLSDAYRVATQDRLRLATVRRLSEQNKTAEAIAAMRDLFPQGVPAGELGIEYHLLLAEDARHWETARRAFQERLRAAPGDTRTRMGLARLLLRRDATRAEGLRLLQALQRDPNADQALAGDVLRRARDADNARNDPKALLIARLERESAEALQRGERSKALILLERAQQQDPQDPWLRYRLAKLYASLDLPDLARELMQDGARQSPNNEDVHYARALLLASLEDDAGTLASLSRIASAQRTEGMRALEWRVRVRQTRRQALVLAGEGRYDAVDRLLTRTASKTKRPDALAGLAGVWVSVGSPDRARRFLRRQLPAPETAKGAAAVAWAELFDRIPDDAALDAILPRVRVHDAESADRWALAQSLRQADRLQRVGDTREALSRIESALKKSPDDERWLEAKADVLLAQGDGDEAVAIYRALLSRRGSETTLLLSRARALRVIGRETEALAILDQVDRRADSADLDVQLALIRQWSSLDRWELAQERMAAIRQRWPKNLDVLMHAGRLARAQRDAAQAKMAFEAARQTEVALGVLPDLGETQTPAERELDRVARRGEGFITSGIRPRTKPGSAGVSDLSALEIPVELRLPVGFDDTFYAHLDSVRIDAGTLPPVYNDAAIYGKVQAFGPATLNNFSTGSPQHATGVTLGVGYEMEHWRFDIGTSSVGFPVVNVLGGVRYNNSVGPWDYAIHASRRPITSSLLSYAGARDPVTGESWGGVTSTGVEARIARDIGAVSTSATVGYAVLAGRNVADNTFASARLAADWIVMKRENHQMTLGAALTHWRYRDNLGEYTFGHGGYYSPQSYLALSTPIDAWGRVGRFSYRLRAGVSYSTSQIDEARFYPTDAGLQAQAAGQPLPSGFTRPVYEASSGAGIGFNLRGAMEYHVWAPLFVGVSLDIDRSEFYAPNVLTAYARWYFDDWNAAVPTPPRPPRSYSDY